MRVPHQALDRPNGRDLASTAQQSAGIASATAAPASLEPAAAMAVAAAVDDGDRLVDVVDLLSLDGFVTGREPFGRSTTLENVRADAALTIAEGRLVRDVADDDNQGRLLTGDGWTLHVNRWKQTRRAHVSVTAISAELADTILARVIDGAVEAPEPTPESVPIGFWHMGPHGPRRVQRDIAAAPWDEIRANYTAAVADTLQRLMALDGTAVNGRLLLLHGEPGTGKTTALRALAQQWRSWCQVDCVLDPERLFGDPAYLMNVALGGGDDEPRWRLLMLEDCDELISGQAKAST
ncbi:MAG TPA: DUF5925 domain-containing protein, partial [Actinoplanes sp.]|nr:DUF5925 domain-containing protein [Actinoplanes sp.]